MKNSNRESTTILLKSGMKDTKESAFAVFIYFVLSWLKTATAKAKKLTEHENENCRNHSFKIRFHPF